MTATDEDEFDPTPWPMALLCAALGGLACLAAFPPYDLWMLLPVSLALLSAALLVRSFWMSLLVSLVWGLAFFVPLTIWANTYAGTLPWVALGVFEALYIVLFGILARTVMVRRGLSWTTAIVVSALWVGVEALRSSVPWGGLPWGATAFALADSPLLNLGPWIGTAGLAFVVAMIGQLLLHGMMALLSRRRRGLMGIAGVWPLALAVGLVLSTVVVPLPVNRAPADRSTMTIAAVQGNMDQIDPATMVMPEGVFDNHMEETWNVIDRATEDGTDIDLVVWPEDSTEVDPRQDLYRASALGQAANAAGAPLLVGTQYAVGEDRRINASMLFDSEGEAVYEYAKRHPVPFGEYVPFRDFFRQFSDKVDLVGRDMIAGDEVGVMDLGELGLGEGRVGVLICFEIAYDSLVFDTVRDGAEVVVVQSNNALFGESDEAAQQLAEAKVLAVVSGRSIVHISTVGESAIFTPEGRQLAYVGHWEQGSLLADVPLRTGITPAVAAGSWTAIGLGVLGGLGWLGALASRRRGLRSSSAVRAQRAGGRSSQKGR
ncbi:apolipoprotein N-acyltransferase [Brachybacterium sp. DNPG3]